ncbi:MAG TPA: hypothetical protein VF796_25835 [Humisphaera sp.]
MRTVVPPGQVDPAAARRRRVVALGTVAAALTVTAALLLVLRPAPLVPGTARTLMAVDTQAQVDALFDTEIPVSASRWRYIYVHHGGSDATAADGPDHFVLGNGRESGDGEVRIGQRWNRQQPAGKTKGLDRVDPDCVSVCLAGDLDRAVPTARQMDQLARLVRALQDRLQVPGERVMIVEAPGLPAGCGKYFPRDAFRAGLIP